MCSDTPLHVAVPCFFRLSEAQVVFFFFLPLIQIEELFAEKAYKANISPAETTEGEETPLNSMKYLQTALGALG